MTAAGQIQDQRMVPALQTILRDPGMDPPPNANPAFVQQVQRAQHELQLAAAGALARMGRADGYTRAMRLCRNANPLTRSHAAWVLSWFGDPASSRRLDAMLGDADAQVRVAAAAAVVRRFAQPGRGVMPPPGLQPAGPEK